MSALFPSRPSSPGSPSSLFAVTRGPAPGPMPSEPAASAAPAAAPTRPQQRPSPLEIEESTDRFKTGCGWCDAGLGPRGTCVAFCGENSGGVSCAAAERVRARWRPS
jgi:hypothetical protein